MADFYAKLAGVCATRIVHGIRSGIVLGQPRHRSLEKRRSRHSNRARSLSDYREFSLLASVLEAATMPGRPAIATTADPRVCVVRLRACLGARGCAKRVMVCLPPAPRRLRRNLAVSRRTRPPR